MALSTRDQTRQIPNLCPRDIIVSALSTLAIGATVVNNPQQQRAYLPLFREVLEEINNDPYLLPSFKYKKLVTLTAGKSDYTWGLAGNDSEGNPIADINLPYPILIDKLFIASDGLSTGAGEMTSDAFTNSTVYYLTQMDRNQFVGSRYVDPSIATAYWIERERPLHTIYFNGDPINAGADTLYGIVKLALAIPQSNLQSVADANDMRTDPLMYPLEVEEGHREYMRLSMAIKAAPQNGKGLDITAPLYQQMEMAKEGITSRQDIPQIIPSENYTQFSDNKGRRGAGYGTSYLESGWF